VPECENCGNHVSHTWARVFGTERCQANDCAPNKGAGELAGGGELEYRNKSSSRGACYPS